MPEEIKDKKVYSLMEVMNSVQRLLSERYKNAFWVKAEMNKLNFYKQSGHCYPDLVEKQNGKIVAQVRAVLWGVDYQRIDDLFRKTLNESLKDGIKILFMAKIMFDPTRGMTLRIFDIDPGYTLGDLEKEKQETIRRLREENVFTLNKSLQIPLLPQRIAIISVETSKGYNDFLGKINSNPWNYKFFYMLFPSVLQGDGIIRSITAQLNRIRKVQHHFDAVAIVRGGGGDIGLASYNSYELAHEIATFPLPVLTGIGHITNETVTEMVAYKNRITPTDLADFFIQQFHNFAESVNKAMRQLTVSTERFLRSERTQLASKRQFLCSSASGFADRRMNDITLIQSQLSDKLQLRLREENMRLDNFGKTVNNLNPREVMRRGYSMTLHNGRPVKNAAGLKVGDTLRTVVYEGAVTSKVTDENMA